jgi:hypothetical protein
VHLRGNDKARPVESPPVGCSDTRAALEGLLMRRRRSGSANGTVHRRLTRWRSGDAWLFGRSSAPKHVPRRTPKTRREGWLRKHPRPAFPLGSVENGLGLVSASRRGPAAGTGFGARPGSG